FNLYNVSRRLELCGTSKRYTFDYAVPVPGVQAASRSRFLEALIGCTSSNASSGRNTGTWGCCTNNESATAQPNTTHYGSVLAAGSKDGHCR
ncbi:hypothetical protein PR002_g26970, partial [Phytophthora rubi]